MRTTRAAVVLATAILLAGCSGSPAPAPTVTRTVTVTPEPAPTVTVYVTPEAAAPSASSDSRQPREATLLAALEGIDPGLVSNPERAVSRADNVCSDIAAGDVYADALESRAEARYEGGTVPDLDAQQVTDLVEAIRAYC